MYTSVRSLHLTLEIVMLLNERQYVENEIIGIRMSGLFQSIVWKKNFNSC